MKKFTKNPFVAALLAMMMFFAIVHVVVLFTVSLLSQTVDALNIFRIVGIAGFIPEWYSSTLQGHFFSLLITIIVYCSMLYFLKRSK